MARGRYHHGDLRGALLDAAETLVRERGADGWSLREASARVGVSPSAAYHHFSSRDALVASLSERVLTRLGERLTVAVQAAPVGGQERLVAYGRTYVSWAMEDLAVARLVFSVGAADPEYTVVPHPHDVLAAELDRLVDLGHLPAAARPGADFVVWAAVHGLAILLIDGLVHVDGERAVELQAERLVRATVHGLMQEVVPPEPWPVPRSARTQRVAQGPRNRPPPTLEVRPDDS